MLIATLKWRDEFKVDEVVNEQFDEKIFGSLGRISGKDKEGCPVVYVSSAHLLHVSLISSARQIQPVWGQ